jgi:heavy metal translocating P-type ATPase
MGVDNAKLTIVPSRRIHIVIASLALTAIGISLLLRFALQTDAQIRGIPLHELPLVLCLGLGGVPIVVELLLKVSRGELGSDLLAGISIVTSVLLDEYLAGSLVVLMLSGGEALEAYAVSSASSVLEALARRMTSSAHRKSDGSLTDVPLNEVIIGETLVVLPLEICPVDGTVVEGRGVMDESYLTGEPYQISKVPGSGVLSGAINGHAALTIRADKLAEDSRYAKIMRVMRASEQRRPRLRRLGDQLGAFYTPLAVSIALIAWMLSASPTRFLAVLVVATPCPLIIAIPVAIIGSISLAARRGSIIKDPAVLEMIDTCRTAIFDKTGTLTYGKPQLIELIAGSGFEETELLALVASLERYSKHSISGAILERARETGVRLLEAAQIQERPGEGMLGTVNGRRIQITSRKKAITLHPEMETQLPALRGGLECVILIDDRYAATFRFRDQPRSEGASFIRHLQPQHHFDRLMLVSGDRESEVSYLAKLVGIKEVYASQTPEQKLELVRQETGQTKTLFLGDGINDAPALTAATVGIAFGQNSDITSEAAGAVILDSSLQSLDEFLHISRRLRAIVLQSAVGGIMLSLIGMVVAAFGYLPPVAGAIAQEAINVLAVAKALRMAISPRSLSDC